MKGIQNKEKQGKVFKQFTITAFMLLMLFTSNLFSQELFPNTEPASTMPKNVFGVRAFTNTYKEYGTQRNMFALRIMYGLLPKLTVMATATMSNHHNENLPKDLITHRHIGNSTIYYTSNIQRGIKYPYQFNGIYAYAKYRLITHDAQNKHFRIALYGEWSNVNSAHDESEPNLLDDTKGGGSGIITTLLNKHFAVSFTSGFTIPQAYKGSEQNLYGGIPIPTELQYGRAINYSLSLGYLLLPAIYESYNQVNWNIYLEITGKSYEQAKVIQYGLPVEVQSNALRAGHYIDLQPGIQKIFDSNLRVDFSIAFQLLSRSYAHYYPMYLIGVQRYFFSEREMRE